MKILHTSDWHLGRTFHQFSVLDALRTAVSDIAASVAREGVDAVVISGDVYDHYSPAAQLFDELDAMIKQIRDAGAQVVMISGNHDSAQRLGARSLWMEGSGVYVRTRADAYRTPITLRDEHGEVDFYTIPYLEPMLTRSLWPDDAPARSHQEVLERVMAEVTELVAQRGHRSVVLSHCFAAKGVTSGGLSDEAAEQNAALSRDITSGGVDVVDAMLFAGVDYAALGHIHSRSTLLDNVRYCGAPLHYTFGEAQKPRGVWIVELDAAGLAEVSWRDTVIPRRLTTLRDTLDSLLTSPAYTPFEQDWVEAEVTDTVRPSEPMRRLKERFPFCAQLRFPEITPARAETSYRERHAGKTPFELIDAFLQEVRNGVGVRDDEAELLRRVVAQAEREPGAAPGAEVRS